MVSKIFQRKSLSCSFCAKTSAQVAKLLGGPKVHICDQCVGVCNRVLEAVPESFAGWESVSDADLLAGLRVADGTLDAVRAVLQDQIDEARGRRISWQKIGDALGVSRQAAWERFS
ncbi:MAG: ClpX C4-type zinc finger protein [Acidobacteriota bacterium]